MQTRELFLLPFSSWEIRRAEREGASLLGIF